MDVRIGLSQSPKELEIHLAEDADPAAVRADIESAVTAGGTLWLTDRKGRQIGVVVDKLAFVEIGTAEDDRRIGFGS